MRQLGELILDAECAEGCSREGSNVLASAASAVENALSFEWRGRRTDERQPLAEIEWRRGVTAAHGDLPGRAIHDEARDTDLAMFARSTLS